MIRGTLIDGRSGCRASSEEPRDAVKRTTEVIVRELAAVIKHGHNLRRDSAEPTGKPKTENSRLSSYVRSPAWAPDVCVRRLDALIRYLGHTSIDSRG